MRWWETMILNTMTNHGPNRIDIGFSVETLWLSSRSFTSPTSLTQKFIYPTSRAKIYGPFYWSLARFSRRWVLLWWRDIGISAGSLVVQLQNAISSFIMPMYFSLEGIIPRVSMVIVWRSHSPGLENTLCRIGDWWKRCYQRLFRSKFFRTSFNYICR